MIPTSAVYSPGSVAPSVLITSTLDVASIPTLSRSSGSSATCSSPIGGHQQCLGAWVDVPFGVEEQSSDL